MRRKILNIQALRGIAILLVLAYHLLRLEEKFSPAGRFLPSFMRFGASGVDLFFVISGFVMATVIRGCFQDRNRITAFLYHRFTRIYPLYWFYTLVVLGVFAVRPQWVNSSQGHQFDLFSSVLLLPDERLPLVMVGWSLIYEVYFYLMIALLLCLPEKWFVRSCGLWAGTIAGAGLLQHYGGLTPVRPFFQLISSPMTIEFIAGCFTALIVYSGRTSWGRISLAAGLVLFPGLTAYLGSYAPEATLGWLRTAVFGGPSVLLVYGVSALELKCNLILPRVFRWIGDISYSMYLSHLLVLAAVGRLWLIFSVPVLWDNLFFLAAAASLAVGAAYFSYRFIETPLLNWTRGVKRNNFSSFSSATCPMSS